MLGFVSGLPRSGSTLLCNILAQRPKTLVTPTSPLTNIVKTLRDNWRHWHRAQPGFDHDGSLRRVLRGVLEGYHERGKELIVDKSRDWPTLIETVEQTFGEGEARIVATSRPMPDIMASMEAVWRRNMAMGRVPSVLANHPAMTTTRNRVNAWLQPSDIVGQPVGWLTDAYNRGLASRILIVDYRDLTGSPAQIMEVVDDFLGVGRFDYDFDNVEQVTVENDELHGYSGLHDIRPRVEPNTRDVDDVLGADLAKELNDAKYPWDMRDDARHARDGVDFRPPVFSHGPDGKEVPVDPALVGHAP